MKSVNVPYLATVDHLRAAAALWIVLYHGLFILGSAVVPIEVLNAAHHSPLYNPFFALWAEGHTAVALFMVLSGFILTVGTYGRPIDYRVFITNRILRIYPLFVAVLMLNVVYGSRPAGPTNVLGTVLPLADLLEATGRPPLVDMAWAVAVECQFYLIMPFLLRRLQRSIALTALVVVGGALALRVGLVLLGFHARDLSYFHLVGRIDQFMLGMVAGVLWHRLPGPVPGWLCATAVLGAVGAIWGYHDFLGGFDYVTFGAVFWPTIEGLIWSCVILTYVGTGDPLPKPFSWILCRIGTMSFSIYLLHPMVIRGLE